MNSTTVHTGLIAAAVIAFFCTWGSFQPQFDLPPEMAGLGAGMTFDITGWNGTFTLIGITMPIWLIVVLTVLGGSFLMTNANGTTAIPKAVNISLFAIPLVFTVFGLITLLATGSPGLGVLIAAAASATGLAMSIRDEEAGVVEIAAPPARF